MLQVELDRRGIDLPVSSAGLLGEQQPATEATSDVAREFDLDLSRHESRQLAPSLVRNANLVIGMERRHVREAVLLDPGAWPRTFTLKEIVRRAESLGARSDGEAFDEWVQRVHSGRKPSALLGTSADDDVEDPTGRPFADHGTTARELSDLVARLAELAWPTSSD
jgi:protein-tyrosine phosphatase